MKRFLSFFAVVVLGLVLTLADAEAKRLGGGTSRGMQRDSVAQQRQANPAPGAPTQQQAASPATPQNPAAAPQAPKRNWLGPIAGLAAGLGLAALLSHFGLGEGLANVLMIVLLVLAAVVVFKMLFRRRGGATHSAPMQYAAAGGSGPGTLAPSNWESARGSAAPVPAGGIPADFDSAGFLRVAKVNFLRLQAAHDAGKLDDLREFTTPEMFAELRLDIDERKGAHQTTDVLDLDAQLIEVVSEGNRHIASVRFRGMVLEDKAGPATPFDEVWNLIKPVGGSGGWTVAGIQQMN